jgi:4-hydroxy-tetrahydrodipicolinate reductase
VDYTHPEAVNDNTAFYCQNELPFVMGTTGGDRKLLSDTVESSPIAAVIAPNMAKQIVGFQAMMEYAFNSLGVPYSQANILKEREPESQKSQWGIPEAYLTGHGWHTYSLVSEDETVKFEFTHNVNGRDIYAKGTLDALIFLNEKVIQGVQGKAFTMIDVLQGI